MLTSAGLRRAAVRSRSSWRPARSTACCPLRAGRCPASSRSAARRSPLKAQGVPIGRRVAFVGAGPLLAAGRRINTRRPARRSSRCSTRRRSAPSSRSARLAGVARARSRKGLWYIGPQRACAASTFATACARFASKATGASRRCAWRERSGEEHRVACDAVGASFGLRARRSSPISPAAASPSPPTARQWLPRARPGRTFCVAGVYLAGDGARIGGARRRRAARRRVRRCAVLEDLGRDRRSTRAWRRLDRALARQARFRARARRAPIRSRPPRRRDRRRRDRLPLRRHHRRGAAQRCSEHGRTRGESAKAFTRIGMGRCQGRFCGAAAAELLARALRHGTRARRPPARPAAGQAHPDRVASAA